MEQIHFLCWCHYQIQCFLLSNNWPPCVTYLTAGHSLCSPIDYLSYLSSMETHTSNYIRLKDILLLLLL